MADELRMALDEPLRKAELERDADFLREGVRVLSQALMELEVTHHLGAERHERTAQRTGQRNGYREREWDTRVGTVELRVPRVRDGSYFPALLEPRRRAERALAAVVQERPSCRRPTSRASRPGGWTTWSRRWGWRG
jgi:transposase-like protein